MAATPTPIDGEKLEDIAGLCLSGGGYRAMLFHAGAITRMNELGLLKRLDRISSVSGGSMAAAALAVAWDRLDWDADGRATNLRETFLAAVVAQANDSIDVDAGVSLLLPFFSSSAAVERSYRRHLTGNARLSDLPERPSFIFNATNLVTGGLVRMRRDYVADWKIGRFEGLDLSLAKVVTASAAFPPVISPVEVDLYGAVPVLEDPPPPYTQPEHAGHMVLTDGGVYDNLGTEAVWKRCRTVFVSDAGMPFSPDGDPATNPVSLLRRVLDISQTQSQDLRERMMAHAFVVKARKGAMWSLTTGDRNLAHRPPGLSEEEYRAAQAVPTRLKRFSPETQDLLLKAGYLHAASRIAAHYGPVEAGYVDRPAETWPIAG